MSIWKIKSLIVLSVFSIYTSNVAAADYDPASLDKLFTDKKQRTQIDASRSGLTSDTGVKKVTKVKINGYMTRSNGKSVVWVNGKNTLDSTRVDDVKVHQSSIGKNKKVTISANGKHKHLKPGEVWHKETGKLVEGY